LRKALEAGIKLPPVIVNANDMRVVDGFHRTTAYLDVFGDDAKIRADLRVYDSDAGIFEDSIRFNASQGLPLSPRDRAHAILKARRFKIPMSVIALAIGITEGDMKSFMEKRTAVDAEGTTIALTYGASELAGKNLNDEQTHFAQHSSGAMPYFHANQLIMALHAKAMKLTDKSREKLLELQIVIREVLS